MKNIGVIAKRGEAAAIQAVRDLMFWLDRKKFRLFVEDEVASVLKMKGYPRDKIPSKIDIMIVFGGDGTLLSAVRLVGRRGTPILGVNLGGLGFITEIARDKMHKNIVDNIFSERYGIEERIMLSADMCRKGCRKIHHTALNDVVITKSALARMIDLDIYVNNQYVNAYTADGLIISTPTGSTAYSLAAGGPILYPTLGSFVITPICPHILTNRPIVLPDEFIIEVIIKRGEDVYLTLDGQEGLPLKVNDKIKIKKADFKTKFLLLHKRDYFQILRTKLKWGE